MSNPQRWTASIEFEFQPILTYARRRSEFVEWVDENIPTAAFLQDEDVFGIAVGSLTQRFRTDMRSARIELLEPSALALDLEDTFAGYLRIVEPPNLHISSYRSILSVPIDGDYDLNRARLARRAVGPNALGEEIVASDCAFLVDFETEALAIKIEFGVVDGPELAERLTGRISGLLGRIHEPIFGGEIPEIDDLPEVSLYAEVFVTPKNLVLAKSAFMGIDTMSQIETRVAHLVRGLGENV